jgi:hypothetical protein
MYPTGIKVSSKDDSKQVRRVILTSWILSFVLIVIMSIELAARSAAQGGIIAGFALVIPTTAYVGSRFRIKGLVLTYTGFVLINGICSLLIAATMLVHTSLSLCLSLSRLLLPLGNGH